MKVKSLSRVRLLATPWTVAHQALPSMGFSRQEYWSGVPLPSPGTDLGIGISEERRKPCQFLGNRLITSIKEKSARTDRGSKTTGVMNRGFAGNVFKNLSGSQVRSLSSLFV